MDLTAPAINRTEDTNLYTNINLTTLPPQSDFSCQQLKFPNVREMDHCGFCPTGINYECQCTKAIIPMYMRPYIMQGDNQVCFCMFRDIV